MNQTLSQHRTQFDRRMLSALDHRRQFTRLRWLRYGCAQNRSDRNARLPAIPDAMLVRAHDLEYVNLVGVLNPLRETGSEFPCLANRR